MGKGFFDTPNPSYATVNSVASQALGGGAGTVLLTAAAIKGGDVPKLITFSTTLAISAAGVAVLTLEKDGVAFDATQSYGIVPDTVAVGSLTVHWVDESPGKGDPVYRVRGTLSSGAVSCVVRRLTVSNL